MVRKQKSERNGLFCWIYKIVHVEHVVEWNPTSYIVDRKFYRYISKNFTTHIKEWAHATGSQTLTTGRSRVIMWRAAGEGTLL